MKKKIIIPILIIIAAIAGGSWYIWNDLESNAFHTETFPAGTEINGVDCSGLTPRQANAALTEEWNSREFTFTKNGEEIGSIKLTDTTYKICRPLKNLREDFFFKTAMNHYFDKPLILTMNMPVKEAGSTFTASLEDADFLKAKNPVVTEDAYLDLSGNKPKIVPEVCGNNIDYTLLGKEILNLAEGGQFNMEYKRKAFHVQPEITADDPALMERQELYTEYLTSNVTYKMGDKNVKVSPENMAKIRGVEISTSGPVTEEEKKALQKAHDENIVIESAVREAVSDFAYKYNTFGKERNFTSICGNKVHVKGGDYGFLLDVDSETRQLTADLKSGEKISREPIWRQVGFVEYSMTDDIGDTYVEISISRQRLWFYKDGKQLVDTPVVTGNPYMGYGTPTGTFGLSYKQRGAVLRGENADGTEYESPVSYWMPFYGNYGMHDANWRYAFGGNIYLGGGSHGCINIPVPKAKIIFENIPDRNVPVIVYY